MTTMFRVTAESVRESIKRFEQFCSIWSRRPSEERAEVNTLYVREYLNWDEEALEAFQEYVEEDDELRALSQILGVEVWPIFVAGVLLGATIVVDATELATGVAIPDTPEDLTAEDSE